MSKRQAELTQLETQDDTFDEVEARLHNRMKELTEEASGAAEHAPSKQNSSTPKPLSRPRLMN
jgi:hypothetical protein